MGLKIQELITDSIEKDTLTPEGVDPSLTDEQKVYTVFHHEWTWYGSKINSETPSCGRQLACLIFTSHRDGDEGITILHLMKDKKLIRLTNDAQLKDLEIIEDD